MDYQQFGEKLFTVTLLLVGLIIFNNVLGAVIPIIGAGESLFLYIRYSPWIGNLIFGVIIYRLTRHSRPTSVSIGILSMMLPVFGALFYLLTLISTKSDK